MTKEERISAEFERITDFFKEIPPNQREFIEPLLQNAAFMKVTLEDLQAIVNAEGVEDEYKNGANQYGTKPSAVIQAYNTMLKNYGALKLKLMALLPKQASVSRLQKMFDDE